MPGTVNLLIPSFLEYLQFEKRYSAHTVKSYATDLHQLDDFLQIKYGSPEVEQLTAPILRSWLAVLKGDGMQLSRFSGFIGRKEILRGILLRR
jgi:integrase/recombinase XerC